jgi:ElaB/YqjD/DUF883 family membrane-anchored ribosome-binding protein
MKNARACALKTGWRLAKIGFKAASLKSNFESAVKDATRTARKGWRAAEETADEFGRSVKRQPFKSIGITFGLALGIGALAGWAGTRK